MPHSDLTAGSPSDEPGLPASSPAGLNADSVTSVSDRPELVIGIVSPLGVDLDPICKTLSDELGHVARYATKIIKVSDIINDLYPNPDPDDVEDKDRLNRLMNGGDWLRGTTRENAICAMLSILEVREHRLEETGDEDVMRNDVATIIRQLKHPSEIDVLREVYGSRFIVVGVSDTPEAREAALRERLVPPSGGPADQAWAAGEATRLLKRDDNDENLKHGQHVRDAFALCDVYLSAGYLPSLQQSVRRLVKLLFGDPFITPTRDEMGVWYAFAAKHRSNAAGRQVGAVITDSDGEVLATGCNDVPIPGGGQNWDGDSLDFRDYTLGYESNDRYKYTMTAELMDVLKNAEWLTDEYKKISSKNLALLALKGNSEEGVEPILKGRRIASLLEFGRIMHAEMAALTTAARRGTPVRGGTLYTTTYPCHECMRLVIGAGIERVVYIDPYPKSLVTELFKQQLSSQNPGVVLEQFLGIAPKLVRRVFDQGDAGRTRSTDGQFHPWDGETAAFKGDATRYVDSTVAKESGIAQMIDAVYVPRLLELDDTEETKGPDA